MTTAVRVTTVGTICCRKRKAVAATGVGGFDCLPARAALDEEDARSKLSSGVRATTR